MIADKVKKELSKVLNEEIDRVNDLKGCPDEFDKILIELGAIDCEDLRTNGWQGDYHRTWEYNDKEFEINGCMYYGVADFYVK